MTTRKKEPFEPKFNSIRLLVDGYNLAFEAGDMQSADSRKNALRIARDKLLQRVMESLEPQEVNRVLVVFDSAEKPPNTKDHSVWNGIDVLFSNEWNSADELICFLLDRHHAPRTLTVVSSDHSIQRKAKARGARAVDCDHWLEEREANAGSVANTDSLSEWTSHEKSEHDLSNQEQSEWLRQFGFTPRESED